MIVTFQEEYLKELYENGQANDKKHRFQPQIIKKYTMIVDLMIELKNVMGLTKYGGLTTNIYMVIRKVFHRSE